MITKFESYKPGSGLIPKERNAWLVPSRYIDEFGGSLIKIGMSDEEVNFWTSKRYKQVSSYNQIMMFKDNDDIWTWSPSTQTHTTTTEFKGEIVPTEQDIDKWKLKSTLSKYNI